jgi:hypothetical protein
VISSTSQNAKEITGFKCPPEKGPTIKRAANNVRAIYIEEPSEEAIPCAKRAVPASSQKNILH